MNPIPSRRPPQALAARPLPRQTKPRVKRMDPTTKAEHGDRESARKDTGPFPDSVIMDSNQLVQSLIFDTDRRFDSIMCSESRESTYRTSSSRTGPNHERYGRYDTFTGTHGSLR